MSLALHMGEQRIGQDGFLVSGVNFLNCDDQRQANAKHRGPCWTMLDYVEQIPPLHSGGDQLRIN